VFERHLKPLRQNPTYLFIVALFAHVPAKSVEHVSHIRCSVFGPWRTSRTESKYDRYVMSTFLRDNVQHNHIKCHERV
jgi:hypothetical protein